MIGVENVAGLVLAVALLAYLVYALLAPDRLG
jgi:K+-transporting ATPase KdpF subunit